MLLFLFISLIFAEKDCYYAHKEELLPCLLMADLDNNMSANKTEITKFLEGSAWNADAILFFMHKSELNITDWEGVNDPNTLFTICMFCKHNKHYF